MTPFRITFEESTQRHCLQTIPDYHVLLNGKRVQRLYWNMRGYRGVLPTPDGGLFEPGEVSLTKFKTIARSLEREAKKQKTVT